MRQLRISVSGSFNLRAIRFGNPDSGCSTDILRLVIRTAIIQYARWYLTRAAEVLQGYRVEPRFARLTLSKPNRSHIAVLFDVDLNIEKAFEDLDVSSRMLRQRSRSICTRLTLMRGESHRQQELIG